MKTVPFLIISAAVLLVWFPMTSALAEVNVYARACRPPAYVMAYGDSSVVLVEISDANSVPDGLTLSVKISIYRYDEALIVLLRNWLKPFGLIELGEFSKHYVPAWKKG